MRKVAFRNGIHPTEGKELSMNEAIKQVNPSDIMAYPLCQHIGEPATEIVKPGDEVLVGQKIAEASSFISSPVYSSVSGKVKPMEDRIIVNGKLSKCIIIENDYEYRSVEGYGVERDTTNLSDEEIIKIVSDAGIVGLGGAGFPTGVKIAPKDPNHIDHLIINGAECEPCLTSDYRLMLEKPNEILKGISIILRLFPNAKAVIGIEDNKPEAIKKLKELSTSFEKIEVKSLKTRYPQGGERRLIASITGRKINSHLLPADEGVVVLNVATIFAIYEAIVLNKPLVHRIVTITGNAVNSPCNVDALLGTNVQDIVTECGGVKDDTTKLICGGPMMGTAIPNLDYALTKTFSSVLAFNDDDVERMDTTACIKCGRCVEACPEDLVPQLMAQAVKAGSIEQFEKLNGMECIECGCCTFVCPAKRPLTHSFKLAKAEIRLEKTGK